LFVIAPREEAAVPLTTATLEFAVKFLVAGKLDLLKLAQEPYDERGEAVGPPRLLRLRCFVDDFTVN
jgi:hypothetical protein